MKKFEPSYDLIELDKKLKVLYIQELDLEAKIRTEQKKLNRLKFEIKKLESQYTKLAIENRNRNLTS